MSENTDTEYYFKHNKKTRLWIYLNKIFFAVNIGLALSGVGFLIISISNNYYWRADFTMFYTGGAIVRDSFGYNLYDLALQTDYQQSILRGGSFVGGLLPFNYPPYVSLLFLPLTYLNLELAYFFWLGIQVLLIVWTLWLIHKISTDWDPGSRNYMIVAFLSIPYLLITLLLGTLSLLMLVALLQLYIALKSKKEYRAGFWLSLLAIKPQFLIIPAVFLLGSKRWRVLTTSLLIGFTLFLFSGLKLGFQVWQDFFNILKFSSGSFDTGGINPVIMHNFKGMMTTILGSGEANLINLFTYLALLISSIWVFVASRGQKNPNSPEFDLIYTLTMILAILFSPHVNPQDSLLLIAPLVVFSNYHHLRPHFLRYYNLFLLILPSLYWISEFWIKGQIIIRLPILIMCVILVWVIFTYVRDRKESLNINL